MELTDKTIALLATDEFEDSELTRPLEALKAAGATVEIISNKLGTIVGKNGTEVTVNAVSDEVDSNSYQGLFLPGGVGNPDKLRLHTPSVAFVRSFFEAHKPVAAICHAPWMLIEAGVVSGRNIASWPSLKTDLENAGASWLDEAVVTDNGLVTSRNPDDIPVFIDKMIEEFAEGTHAEQTV